MVTIIMYTLEKLQTSIQSNNYKSKKLNLQFIPFNKIEEILVRANLLWLNRFKKILPIVRQGTYQEVFFITEKRKLKFISRLVVIIWHKYISSFSQVTKWVFCFLKSMWNLTFANSTEAEKWCNKISREGSICPKCLSVWGRGFWEYNDPHSCFRYCAERTGE